MMYPQNDHTHDCGCCCNKLNKLSDQIRSAIKIANRKDAKTQCKKTHHGDREVYADNRSPVGGWQARHHL